jgi:hypothetical protein
MEEEEKSGRGRRRGYMPAGRALVLLLEVRERLWAGQRAGKGAMRYLSLILDFACPFTTPWMINAQ